MSRRGLDDSMTRMQYAVAAALCAVGLALALVPPDDGPGEEAAPARTEMPAPARPDAGGGVILTVGPAAAFRC